MLASLKYYWRLNLAVVAAAATLTAVLTGALLVGDSMRGSLRALVLDRLGSIDLALLGEGFFREQLAQAVVDDDGWGTSGRAAAPAILIQGSAESQEGTARASAVTILGVDQRFAELYGLDAEQLPLERAEGQTFPSVVLNQTLADELGAAVGDAALLRLARPSDIPRESLMGSTDPADVVRTLRVVVRAVVPNRGVGRFGLIPHQSLPNDAFVRLSDLQRALDQPERANALFLASGGGAAADAVLSEQVEAALRDHLELADLGLRTEVDGAALSVGSREILLRPGLENAVRAVGESVGAQQLLVSTYLANRVVLPSNPSSGGPSSEARVLPYSTVAALSLPAAAELGTLRTSSGAPIASIPEGGVVLNRWAAEDLAAVPGQKVRLDYWEVGAREELVERSVELEVSAIAELEGLGADPKLTPDFPGVSDAQNMSDWSPTFPVDLDAIRDRDEDYWDRYRGAPKLFVDEQLGRKLWGSRFGDLTAVRLASELTPEQLSERLHSRLAGTLDLKAAGLDVLPMRADGLRSAEGATDFGGLFVGFSLFLIVAAAMLVGLFFRLGVERRARELGLRLAVGETPARVARAMLGEGLALSALGAVLGVALAVGYAALMVRGLATWWRGAVGTEVLTVHASAMSLGIGVVASVLVAALSIWLTVRRLARRPVPLLLHGVVASVGARRKPSRARWVAVIALLLGLGLVGGAMAVPSSQATELFFGAGALLLISGLAGFAYWLRFGRLFVVRHTGLRSLVDLSLANASRNPGRTLLGVSLVAASTFVIVAIGAFGHGFEGYSRDRSSGGGGFQWVGESDVPIYGELAGSEALAALGLSAEQQRQLEGSSILPLGVVPGDDVSCLNLFQPKTPRLLGVPHELIERGGFTFQQLTKKLDPGDNPWRLLDANITDEADGEESAGGGAAEGTEVIPAFGDYNSVQWILKSGLDQDVVVTDEQGKRVRLRLVGLLGGSMFQSELLISEAQLRRHFPSRGGARFFLIETPPGEEAAVAQTLETALGDFGFDATSVAQRLASFQAVENTYLATFQTLGGLGLLLGTLGLAVILLRNTLERLGELATLRAVGFRRRTLGATVVGENLLVLVAGIVIGAVAALLAVAPHLRGGGVSVPWGALAWTLGAVVAVGLLACLAAVRQALRVPLMGTLRAE